MSESLYDISRDFAAAFEAVSVDEETGELSGIETVEAVQARFEEKAEAIACFIKNRMALAAGLKLEETAMSLRRKTIEKQIDMLKAYLSSCCKAVDCKKLETTRCKISFRKSESVEIMDASLLPDTYIKTKVETVPDKTGIKAAIKAGDTVPGARLEEKENIQIK